MKKIILPILLVFIISSCSTKKTVVENKVEPIATTETTLSTQLAQGKSLYENNCAKCHDLPKTKQYSAEDWKPIMVSMQKKAHISDLEREQIYNYVTYN